MKKILYTVTFLAVLLISSAKANAEDLTTQMVESYLNGITTISSDFTQTNSGNNEVVKGKFYLKRPGKVRFEYQDPIKDFIVSDGSYIYYYDAKMQQHSAAPIEDSLGYFFLKDKISLSEKGVHSSLVDIGEYFQVTVTSDNPDLSGSLVVTFSKNPITLKKWTIIDSQNVMTTIALDNVKSGEALSDKLFYFYAPDRKKSNINN